jgi:hypothetical protein
MYSYCYFFSTLVPCIVISKFCIPLFNSVSYVFLLLFFFHTCTMHRDIIEVLYTVV